jgi:hypothetical protein
MNRSALRLLPVLLLLSASCGGDDPFSPTEENVAGTYEATALTVTAGGITVNALGLGASLELVLNPGGTTTGRLLAPGLGEGGEDIDADLTGTWSLTGSTVTFEHTSDTFIRDVPFTAERNRLSAEGTFQGAVIRATLTKT